MNTIAEKTTVDWIAFVLVIVGGVNWGLVGLGGLMGSNLNLVNMLLGWNGTVENVVYLLVGVAALYAVYKHVIKKE